jgi:plastocyanin
MPAVHRILAVIGLVLAVAAAPLAAAPTARAADHTVVISYLAFGPSTLTVTAGDTVTWTNADTETHTVTAEAGAFASGNLDTGATFSFTFTEPGTYPYRCDIHIEMQGSIVVQAAEAPQPAAPSPAAPSTAPATDAGNAGGQPNTALPAPAPGAWLVPLLIGLGLVALAVGLIPRATRTWRASAGGTADGARPPPPA